MVMQTLANLLRTWRVHPATKGRLADSIARFVRWQAAARLHNGPLVFPFVGGTRLIAMRGQTGITGNLYFGLAEFPEMAFLLHYLRPNDLFIDVGANVGVFCVLASGAAGASSIAFEPMDATAQKMKDVLRLNDIADRVEVRMCALGAEPGTVKFFDGGDTVNRVIAEGEIVATCREVPQSTLDRELAGREPRAIKLDVEGYELAVLKGASHVLQQPSVQVIILEVLDDATRSGRAAVIERLLREAGFAPHAYDAATRNLSPVGFGDHESGLSDNVLMIRDVAAVRARVETAPRFTVVGRSF